MAAAMASRRSAAESCATSRSPWVRTMVFAAQVGDDDRDVRAAGVDADDGGGIRSQLEPPRRPALAVVAGRARIGEFAHDAALDQLVDARRSSSSG